MGRREQGTGHRGAAAKRPRVEVTLRGVRITDHPKNRPELRGVVVPWERMGRHEMFDEEGRRIMKCNLALALREREQRTARRARNRRWRQLIVDGAVDVTERFDWARREGLQLGVVGLAGAATLGVAAAMAWRDGVVPLGQTLPEFVWLEWLVAILTGAMMLLPILSFVPVSIDFWRSADRVRVTDEWLEAGNRGGETDRRAWSSLRHLRRTLRGNVLVFNDGTRLRVLQGRIQPVLDWQRSRVSAQPPPSPAAALRGAIICLVAMQAASILMAYVFARTPDPEPHQTPLTAYAMTSVVGIMLSGVFWLIRMNDVRSAKRARPRVANAR